MAFLIFIGISLVIWFFSWIIDRTNKARLYEKLKPQLDSITSKEKELILKAQELDQINAQREKALVIQRTKLEQLKIQQDKEFAIERAQWEEKVLTDKKLIQTISREKSQGFPWLAKAYADFFLLKDLQTARLLEIKSHPAMAAAEKLREVATKRREAERLLRVYRYQLEFYESLFPWLAELREIDDDDMLLVDQTKQHEYSEGIDPAVRYLSPGEYENLTREEKFQRALDRYWLSRKTKWQLGRDYERFIGYIYEKKGWNVTYFGIIKGFEDLGRDLLYPV